MVAAPNQTTRTYNLAGSVTSQVYPSGNSVTYTYDAAGRTSSFSGNLADGVSRTYANNITYSPFGGPSREQFGTNTPLYHKSFYNIRGQLFDTRLSSVNDLWDWNRGRLILYYSSNHLWSQSGTDNNGNVLFAETWIPPENATLDQTDTLSEQSYEYDALNRLKNVTEHRMSVSSGWGNWQQQFKQSYDYDQYGNRTIKTGSADTWGTGINNRSFEIEATTNRLYSPGDLALADTQRRIRYDAAGNQFKDTYTGYGNATFDAENRIITIQDNLSGTSTYAYNADGQRTRRKINNQETWQVYGFDGELLAEYPANGPATSPQKEYGYRNGQLVVTAGGSTDSVVWTSAVGVTVSGNSLSKPGGDGWDAGAVSTQSISSGDGYVEFAATETNRHRRIGLSNGNSNQSWEDIDYCIYLEGSGTVYINEGTTPRGSFGSYASGDVFRVAVEGGVVKYRKNGALLYQSTIFPTYPLLVDTALYSTGASLTNVKLVLARNVVWTSAVGVTVSGNSLSKPGWDGWDAGAVSTQSISSGDGYVEFTATETNKHRRIGLSNGNANQSWEDIDYCIYLEGSGTVYINEGTTPRGSFGSYAPGDVFRVAVEGGVVKYRKNGALLYQSTISPTYPLLVDTALYSTGATLTNVVLFSYAPQAKIYWLVTDHLGTPRMIVDQTGTLASVKRHDYLPFGEELFAGTGVRSEANGYGCPPAQQGCTGDGVRQQFTQKERDVETGLDYFINRYYSSTQGRFTSADPIPMTSQRPSDPQRLNLYAYVRGNPSVNVDPNGLDLYATGSEAQRYVDDLEKATKLKLQLDSKTGKISIISEGKKLSKEAQRIKTIIGDTKNIVRIEAIRDTAGTRQVTGGRFEGGGRQTLDYADIDKFGKQKGGTTRESVVIHETTEAYEGLTNPQALAATSLFQQLTAAHQAATEYENSYRRGQGLGERIDSNQIIMTQGNQTLVVIDFTTHKERVVVDNNTQQIKSVEVKKKQ